ncbi:Mss4-like protein [Coniochaeta sp. 2T2.1]|nr:Mss4-like protein [Coniochaeta sp. 2T2.1]
MFLAYKISPDSPRSSSRIRRQYYHFLKTHIGMPSGSCLCTSIKYTFTGDPVGKALCHCNECKKLTSSVFGYYLLVPRQNLHVTTGKPKVFTFKHKSGYTVTVMFCPDCGTRLYKEFDREQEKDLFFVLAGSVDEPDIVGHKPDLEIWTTERVGWLPAVEGAGQFAQFT